MSSRVVLIAALLCLPLGAIEAAIGLADSDASIARAAAGVNGDILAGAGTSPARI